MSCSSNFLIRRCRQGFVLVALMLLPFTVAHAQSRSAATQFDSVTINDQVNLQVLQAVVKEMNNSFNRSCTDPSDGTVHNHGTSWTNNTCKPPLTGQVTYTCISGYVTVLSTTCH